MFRGDKTKNKNYEQTLTLKLIRKMYFKTLFQNLGYRPFRFFLLKILNSNQEEYRILNASLRNIECRSLTISLIEILNQYRQTSQIDILCWIFDIPIYLIHLGNSSPLSPLNFTFPLITSKLQVCLFLHPEIHPSNLMT